MPIPSDDAAPERNAYGRLTQNFNNDPAKYLWRADAVCGTASKARLPGCSSVRGLVRYSSLSDFRAKMETDWHGTLHPSLGGAVECADDATGPALLGSLARLAGGRRPGAAAAPARIGRGRRGDRPPAAAPAARAPRARARATRRGRRDRRRRAGVFAAARDDAVATAEAVAAGSPELVEFLSQLLEVLWDVTLAEGSLICPKSCDYNRDGVLRVPLRLPRARRGGRQRAAQARARRTRS